MISVSSAICQRAEHLVHTNHPHLSFAIKWLRSCNDSTWDGDMYCAEKLPVKEFEGAYKEANGALC
jgi:hypothetical protein